MLATEGNYPFGSDEVGRSFLLRVRAACRQWQQVYGAVDAESSPEWISSRVATEVREAIGATPLNLPEQCREYVDADVSVLREVLDGCAHSASVELAFRLLLRIHLANFIPVESSSWEAYLRIAEELSLGEELLSSLEFLVS
ncbi:hypothetical protein [Streptomyces sirii]|uniref:hypothetical protein n=1 Tax=Streptomyces sirii TaxID=3127701 RepID=UPI003D361537